MENLTEKIAIEFLKSKGYLTDYFFHRIDVQRKYNATDEEADDIIRTAVGSDGIMERIFDGIDILCNGELQAINLNRDVTESDLMIMSRDGIIGWLCWNDRNGVYTDYECELEGIEPLTREEALQIALEQIRG
jgi:hypothetical protein